MLCPKTSRGVDISVAVGPMLSSSNEKAKAEDLPSLAPSRGLTLLSGLTSCLCPRGLA